MALSVPLFSPRYTSVQSYPSVYPMLVHTDYRQTVYRLQKSVSVQRLTDYRDRGWRLKPSPPWSRAPLTTASDAGNTVHQSQLRMQVGLDSGYSLGCVADVASVAVVEQCTE